MANPSGALALMLFVGVTTLDVIAVSSHRRMFRAPANATKPAAELPGICKCHREHRCTCGDSLEYLQCVIEACAGDCKECGVHNMAHQCDVLTDHCGATLEFDCHNQKVTCDGMFHQARDGLTGLEVITNHNMTDDAFCGPTGKCLGRLHVIATVHQPEPNAWMECAVPRFVGALDTDSKAWNRCRAKVNGTTSSCYMPMVPYLDGKSQLESFCWLTKGMGGKRTTKNSWFMLQNRYHKAGGVNSTTHLVNNVGLDGDKEKDSTVTATAMRIAKDADEVADVSSMHNK